MKAFRFTLLSLATIALAGCSPKNPPSMYDVESVPAPVQQPDLPPRNPMPAIQTNRFDVTTGRYEHVLTSVYFGFDKYAVSAGERAKLQAIVEKAKTTQIVVAGYTDYYGTEQYNLGLSDKRAQSVKNYLVKLGVPAENIEIQGYGKQFAKHGGTKAEVAGDRRADIADLNAK